MNTQVLTEQKYKGEIIEFITYWKTNKPQYNNVIHWWEIGKLHIQMITRNYCKQRKKEQAKKLHILKTYIESENEQTQPNEVDIEKWYEEIRDIHDNQNQGVIVRSRVKDIINGEKPSKYFYHREVNNKEKSVINAVKTGPNTYTTARQTTQNEIKFFYQTLYTKQDTSAQQQQQQQQQQILDELDKKLPQHVADKLDRPITNNEL